MPALLKKRPKLSVKMQLLKDNIHELTLERKSLMEHVYERSKFASVIAAGVNRVFSVFASFLSSFSAVPLIGSFFQGVAAIPEGLAYFSDPKKSIKEKLISAVVIVVLVAIALTVFLMGSIPTLILSTVVASFFALMEGFNLLSRIFEKYKISKSFNEKNEFVNLINARIIPKDDKFNEELEIRAIELEHDIDQTGLRSSIRKKMIAELDFINNALNQKKIIIGSNKENNAFQLSRLYEVHKEQINALSEVLALITSETELEGNQEVLDEIQKLQNEILTTEEEIISITRPIKLLKFQNDLLPSKLIVSLTNLGIAAAGTVTSVFALLIGLAILVAPPVLLPVMVVVSITLAFVGLSKWIAEKMIEQEERSFKTQNEINRKDMILSEALIAFEHKNNLDSNSDLLSSAPLGDSNNSKQMHGSLDKGQSAEPDTTHAISDAIPYHNEFKLFTRKKATRVAEKERIRDEEELETSGGLAAYSSKL